MAADRLERVTNLLAFLESRGERGATLAEIVDAVPGYPPSRDARRKAFQRDREELRAAGIEVQTNGDRYRVTPELLYLPDIDLTEEEQIAIRSALLAAGLGAAGQAVGKLAAGAGATRSLGDGTAVLAAIDVDDRLVPAAIDAYGRRAVLRFRYGGEEREVEPHLVFVREGVWYVYGFDRGRRDLRRFRLDRVEGDLAVGSPGSAPEPPSGLQADDVLARDRWARGSEQIVATLRVDAGSARRAVNEAGADAEVTALDGGGVELRIPVAHRGAFRSWVLGFLDATEIVGPEDLRQEMVAWLTSVVER